MEVLLLNKDGRCKWLESKVMHGLIPTAIKMAANPFADKMYVIVDWISNDHGRVGVDLKWFKSLGVPAVKSYSDLPQNVDLKVINTGYDSIVDQELALREHGVEIIDKPCPFIRRLRAVFEEADPHYQYVFLCEPNHLMMKNFASIFPEDMIVVQMPHFQEQIRAGQIGKPLRIVPYVTYLERHAQAVFDFVEDQFGGRGNDKLALSCLWIHSKASPIVEIDQLSPYDLRGIEDALLVTTKNSSNKSLLSMEESLQAKSLRVVQIGSLWEFLRYERAHHKDKVLLVRSPIPNEAEAPILAYLDLGIVGALWVMFKQIGAVRAGGLGLLRCFLYARNCIWRERAKREAAAEGVLKRRYNIERYTVRQTEGGP
ncbi:MAG: LytB [Pseudomonadota bacterium]